MELATLIVAALVDTTVFVLAATLWGTYTVMFRDSPIYYNVCTTRLVVLLSTLGTHLRDDSLSIDCTIPCLSLGTSAHFCGYLDELCFSIEGSVLQL